MVLDGVYNLKVVHKLVPPPFCLYFYPKINYGQHAPNLYLFSFTLFLLH